LSATSKPGASPGSPAARREAYAQWAEACDRSPSPVVTLARRVMEPLLRDVRDKVVVDVGTGHQLELLVARGSKAVGVDFTPETLRKAAKKQALHSRLVLADTSRLPFQQATADLVICSFVLSFVDDLPQLAEQLARIVLPGGEVHVTDIHPDTQRHGWPAALDPTLKEIRVNVHELTSIAQAFDQAGLALELSLEPRLGHPERRHFELAQRMDLYEQARHVPAICLLHFRRRVLTADRNRPHLVPRKRQRTWHLVGARQALGPHTAVHSDIALDATQIRGIYDRPSKGKLERAEDDAVVDLTGLLLLPGLINAHDCLQAGWPERVHPDVAPWLGAIRNVFSGVTTVRHDTAIDPATMAQFPVHLARGGVRSARHKPEEIAADFADAPPNVPLIIDLSWCAAETNRFIGELEKNGLLSNRTILVGLAELDTAAQNSLVKHGTSAVWSPASTPLRCETAISNHLIALGTGGLGKTSISDEIRAALKMAVSPEAIYSMVTSRAASILRLRNGEGRIVAETPADLVAIDDSGLTPAESLCSLDCVPAAVIVGGKLQLLSGSVLERVPEALRESLRPMMVGDAQWWAEEHIVAAVRGARGGLRLSGQPVTV
jgi:SAM-dependent methyltransferase